MRYVLTKASDDEFMEIVDFDLDQINALAFSKGVIIKENWWFNEDNIATYMENKTEEFCDKIKEIPLEIMIYDSYIE